MLRLGALLVAPANFMSRRRPKVSADNDAATGARIRAQRRARKMTQLALAEALGITFQQLQMHEQGRSRISARCLQEMASVLGVPLAALTGTDGAAGSLRLAGLGLADTAGAIRLMRAYTALPTPRMKRALVRLAEQISGVET